LNKGGSIITTPDKPLSTRVWVLLVEQHI